MQKFVPVNLSVMALSTFGEVVEGVTYPVEGFINIPNHAVQAQVKLGEGFYYYIRDNEVAQHFKWVVQ